MTIVTAAQFSKAKALLVLARADRKRCQGGSYLMRVLSNYALMQKDVSSIQIKLNTHRLSKAAYKIRSNLDLGNAEGRKELGRQTVNEHPEPLKTVWDWIVANPDTICAKSIIQRIYTYPMVTITREEDRKINQAGYRSSGEPEIRFEAGGIELHGGESLRQRVDLEFETVLN